MKSLNDYTRRILRAAAIAWGSVLTAVLIVAGAVLVLPLIRSLIAFQWGCHF